jgi:hypothetical protein
MYWIGLTIVVLAIKLVILLLDHQAMFYMGDSGAYLASAVTTWLPGDRSFVYGFVVIKSVLALVGSLTGLVVAQSVAAAGSAVLLAAVLEVGFQTGRLAAAVAALAYAIEPIGMLYERYVMTECFALLAFAGFALVAFLYLRRPRLVLLPVLAILSAVVIAFRVSFLPVLLGSAVVLPWLAHVSGKPGQAGRFAARRLLHLLFLLGLTFATHSLYKQWYHHLTGEPPAYNDSDGLFLLAAWSPLLAREDFPDPALYDTIIPNVRPPITATFDPRKSEYGPTTIQMFGADGLISQLTKAQPNHVQANALAKQIAYHIAARDTRGVIKSGLHAYLDYWNPDLISQRIRIDLGHREMDAPLIEIFSREFGEDISGRHLLATLSKRYYAGATLWYRIVPLAPAIWLLAALMCLRRRAEMALMGLYVFGLLVPACMLINEAWIRYLHPLAWVAVGMFGVILAQGLRLLRNRARPPAKEPLPDTSAQSHAGVS